MKQPSVRFTALVAVIALAVTSCGTGSNNTKSSSTTAKPKNAGTAAQSSGLFPTNIVNKAVHVGTPKPGGEITFGLESDILDVSPNQNVIQPADVQMAYAVFDPLLSYGDSGKYKGVPVTDNTDHHYNQLADSITHSDDLKTWTLTLRKGVQFSDGTPLTAADVVDHTNWALASTNCSCKSDAENIASVSSHAPLTVTYVLKEPVVDFPGKITGGGLGWVVEPKAREAASDPSNPGIKNLIGTGPFEYKGKSGDSYTVVKNQHYYGKDPATGAKLPYLDKITFKPLDDSTTRLQAVQSNGVQIMQTADTSNLVQAKADSNLKVQPSEGSSSTIVVLNLLHPPFGVTAKPGESPQATAIRSLDDPDALKARQAFNYSINRNEINQKYYKGTRVPSYGYFPASNPYYNPNGQLPRFDPMKAKKFIAGLKAKGLSTKVNSMCINTPEATGIFAILKQQGEAVGINSTLKTVEQAVLVQTLLAGSGDIKWDVACFRSAQLADPDGIYGGLVTGGPANLIKYSRADVDSWLNEARKTADEVERKKLYGKIQAQLSKDVVIVPLLFDYYGNVFQKNISGLSTPSPSSLGIIRPGQLFRKS